MCQLAENEAAGTAISEKMEDEDSAGGGKGNTEVQS